MLCVSLNVRVVLPFLVWCGLSFSASSPALAQWQREVGVGPLFGSGSDQEGTSICYCDGLVWAGGQSLYRSNDLGISWSPVASFMTQTILGIAFFDTQTGVVMGSGGAWLTKNGGQTWKLLFNSAGR